MLVTRSVRIDFSAWLLAWERYSLAADLTRQMDLHSCNAYKSVVAEVAADAVKERKKPELAVLYDELLRQYLEEMSGVQCLSAVHVQHEACCV